VPSPFFAPRARAEYRATFVNELSITIHVAERRFMET
jgi:hypothetical protein